MSTNPGLTEKFNFRGSPKNGEDFYMLAVLRKENIPAFIQSNPNSFTHLGTEEDKYFFLCQNQYPVIGDDKFARFYDRLYWSADPDDFQYNSLSGYMNQGVVRVNVGNANRNLMYKSSLNGFNTSYRDGGNYYNAGSQLGKLTRGKKPLPVTFVRKKIDSETGNYALKDNYLFYSIPYSIFNSGSLYSTLSATTTNNIEWIFRKYDEFPTTTVTGQGSGRSVGMLNLGENGVNNSDKIINFVQLDTLKTMQGTSLSHFNYGTAEWYNTPETMGTSFYGTSPRFIVSDQNNFIRNNSRFANSIVRIKSDNGLSESVINYDYMYSTATGTSIMYNIGSSTQRGLTGTDYNIDINTDVNIQFNIRNSEQCFTPLTEATDFNELFDIYLLPVEENSYLPGAFHITDPHIFPTSCSLYGAITASQNGITPVPGPEQLKFFSHESREPFTFQDLTTNQEQIDNFSLYFNCTGDQQVGYNHFKELDYRKIYNLLFFFTIKSLNPDFWNGEIINGYLDDTTGLDKYPNIASQVNLDEATGAPTGKSTVYMWDTYAESSAGYMFNYCRGSEVCGRCSGNNVDAQNICFADSLTREYAVLSNTPSGKILQPLTGKERATGTHSNPGNHLPTFVIVIISVLAVLFCIIVISVLYVRRKKWREESV